MKDTIAYITLLLSVIFIITYCIRKNNNFIDIRKICNDFFSIFHPITHGKKVFLTGQIFFFFIVPALITTGVVLLNPVNLDIVNNTLVVIAIFVSMLFAILSIVINMNNHQDNTDEIANVSVAIKCIMFEIFICVLIAILGLAFIFLDGIGNKIILYVFSCIFYYLCFISIFDLLIITKKLSILVFNK